MVPKLLLSGCRILLVEDEYFPAMDLADLLKKAGAEVVGPVSEASEAVELLKEASVDAAIIDINLGHGSDFALADRLISARIPFMFATGYNPSSIPEPYRNIPYVEKPVQNAALLKAVAALLPKPV